MPDTIKRSMRKRTQVFIDALVERGWLKPVPPPRGETKQFAPFYEVTDEGSRVGHTVWSKRLPRAKAEQMVKEMIERADEINANPELLAWVNRIRAFGSYITDAADLGDIDLVIDTERRTPDGESFVKASQKRARASGKSMQWFETLVYGDTEVRRLLRARNRYLSFHGESDLEKFSIEGRVIYERKA
jgi:hypothetical protein